VRKSLVVLLVTFLLVTAAAWGQQDSLLGPHDVSSKGCGACHVPHNALPGKGMFLWAGEIPTRSYDTYLTATGQGGAGKLSANIADLQNGGADGTAGGTILCLSCHDTAFSGMGSGTGGAFKSGQTTAPSFSYSSGTYGTSGPSNTDIGTGGNLKNDHPVHVKYPKDDQTYWAISFDTTANTPNSTAALNNVFFTDTAFAYGHPATLFTTNGKDAYVECASCHNPHSQSLTVQTTVNGKKSYTTVHFLRGAYNTSADQSNFCMSCHAMPADAWQGAAHR